ncbi:MAG: GNAT family N-acetyltransferase [Ruminococcus sp.]|nr:GNAT family N-acetyltransferase [Ruminococcus sp.]
MELTRLDIRDKEIVKELFRAVFTNEPWNDDWSDEAQLDAYITDLTGNPTSLTFGYFEDGRLVGMTMGSIKHWYRGTEYVIDEFCILTERQGCGIGSAFFAELERVLAKMGIYHIFLQTDENMPAYDFYKKHGLTELKGHVSFAKSLTDNT